MKHVHIRDFLAKNETPVEEISLGDFDYIGEYTAKKARDRSSPLWHSTGAFFRPNYERGILIHSLITKHKLNSYLEIGFGRGYSAICAARALYDMGSSGTVTTVDPMFDEKHLQMLSQVFPKEWLVKINFIKGKSQDVIPELLKDNKKFDLIYIDGDHHEEPTRNDWLMLKDAWTSFCLFDDYHLPTKTETAIECAKVIDEIDETQFNATKELIILDRRLFIDDRRYTDNQIDYGQVLLSKIKEPSDW